MCLAIPARITEFKEGNIATVDILGVTRQISVDLTPQATLDLIDQIPELVDDME